MVYMVRFIKKIIYLDFQKLKKKKLDDIICRSSGPSIISAYIADKYFNIGRISNLAYCVY